MASDYDSLYRLGQFDSGIPLNTYDKEAASGRDSPAEYYYGDAGPRDAGLARYGEAKEMGPDAKRVPHKKRWWILAGVVVLLTVLVVAIAVPLTTLLDNDNVSGAKDGATVPGTGPKGQVLTSGGDGSKIRMDNGTIFTYTNRASSCCKCSHDLFGVDTDMLTLLSCPLAQPLEVRGPAI